MNRLSVTRKEAILYGSAQLCCFGLCLKFAWRSWFIGSLEGMDLPLLTWCPRPLAGLTGVGMLVFGLLYARRGISSEGEARLDVAATLALVAASLVAALPLFEARMPATAALALAGFGTAWCHMRWAAVLSVLKTADIFTVVFGSCFLGSLMKIALELFPGSATAVLGVGFSALMFVTIVKARRWLEDQPVRQIARRSVGASCIVKISLGVVAYSLIEAIIPTILHIGANSFSLGSFIVEQTVVLVLSGLIVGWVVLKTDSFNFGDVWAYALVASGALLLLVTFGGHKEVSYAVMHGLFVAMWYYLWIVVIETSRYAKMNQLAFIGLLSGLSWIPYTLCSAIVRAVGTVSFEPVSFTAFFVLVSIILFCTDLRNADLRSVLTSAGSAPWYPEDFATIDDRCRQVGEEKGLTKREVEVMSYVAKGRSRAYIAERLFISETTVKAHVKHVYTKLGVRSKQELQDALGIE